MPETDQVAVVQELYRRRDTLDPQKRAIVDELAKRFKLSQPDRFEEIQSDLKANAPKGIVDHLKNLGSALISPITSMPGAVQQVGEFIADPGSVARRNLNPETASGVPGAMSSNPSMEAYGNLLGAVATAKGTPSIHQAAINRLQAAGPQEAAAVPPPAVEAPPPQNGGGFFSGGFFSGIRNLYGLYRTLKSLKNSPIRLAEKGFEGFLDYMEGKPEAPAAAAPAIADPMLEGLAQAQPQPVQPASATSSQMPAASAPVVPVAAAAAPEPIPAPVVARPPAPAIAAQPLPEAPPYQEGTVQSKLQGLSPEIQQKILAFRARKRGLPIPTTEAVPAPEPAAAPAKPSAAEVAQQLRGEMARSGTLPTDIGSLPAKEAAQIVADRMAKRKSNVVEIPEAAPGKPTLVQKPTRGKGNAQASKDAQALVQKLIEWGATPDEVAAFNDKGWTRLAFEAGVPKPSAAVQGNAIFGLKKVLAGPARTVPEMIQSLKTSLEKK